MFTVVNDVLTMIKNRVVCFFGKNHAILGGWLTFSGTQTYFDRPLSTRYLSILLLYQ